MNKLSLWNGLLLSSRRSRDLETQRRSGRHRDFRERCRTGLPPDRPSEAAMEKEQRVQDGQLIGVDIHAAHRELAERAQLLWD